MSRMFEPAHPGEILREFIPDEMTVKETASRLGVSRVSLSRILNGKSGISAEMAIRIGLLTGTTPESWLDNQVKWDLREAESRPRPNCSFTESLLKSHLFSTRRNPCPNLLYLSGNAQCME